MSVKTIQKLSLTQTPAFNKEEVLRDYRIANESRQASLLGRREVLTGKGKFGIFGDGKEVAQLAMARVFRKGDWRSGYYRDQTFMFASGLMKVEEFFAQIYGDTDAAFNPMNAGRLMGNHFSTRNQDENGKWLNLMEQKNSSADISPTAGQMPRLLGLALTSKLSRSNPQLAHLTSLSVNGNEVAFGTIGDASTSEGHFWETINAAGVLQVPMAVSVWDDGFGISVPNYLQTTKSSISEVLRGFEKTHDKDGFLIYTAKGWDYAALCNMYEEGINICREKHIPVLFHITEVTQPLGHSTSGSHERYKTAERLAWEKEFDCIQQMRKWIISESIASGEELDQIEKESVERVKQAKKSAWNNYQKPLNQLRDEFLRIADVTTCNCAKTAKINAIKQDLRQVAEPIRKDIMSAAKKILRLICDSCSNPSNS